MPRGLWSGTLSFGLVAVPVYMVSATRDRDIRFHEIDADSGERVVHKRVCASDQQEVPWAEIGHGYELDGALVTLSSEELASAAPQRTRTIEIEEFVALSEIDPAQLAHPYFLLPDSDSQGVTRAYRLLRDALARTGQVAIGRVVMRSKEYLVAVRERDGLLGLSTMLFADELRDPGEIDAVPADGEGEPPREQEIEEAVRVLEAMAREFDPSAYEDRHRARLMQIIKRKRRTGEVELGEEGEEAPPEPVSDLMAALRESLARVRGE